MMAIIQWLERISLSERSVFKRVATTGFEFQAYVSGLQWIGAAIE